MTIAPPTPAPARPFGQNAIAILLLINASICVVVSLLLYLGERAYVVEFQLPIALLYSLNPPLALASIASPILIFRRSALGLILAWSILCGLLVDILLSVAAIEYFPPLMLKIPIDLAILVTLAVFLIRRATYQNLNVASYGFPVIARALGTAQAASPAADGASHSPSPMPLTPVLEETLSAQVARNIKEAHMQSYILTANFLRGVAFITRIITIVMIMADLLLIIFQLYLVLEPMLSHGSPYFSSSGRESAMMLIYTTFLCLLPMILLILLFIATYLLTGIAEILRCQAGKPT